MYSEESKIPQNIFKPQKIVLNEQNQHTQVKKIYAAGNRSYAVFLNEVVSWGQVIFVNENEHISANDSIKDQSSGKTYTNIPINVTELALGSNHTFAYTKQTHQNHQKSDSSVYCWGSNKNYELGLESQKVYGLVKVDLFDEAFEAGFILSQISCGQSHTLAVFKDSQSGETKMFGWGESKSYQLALDTTGIVPYPVDIQYEFTSSIDKVYSKSDYNIVIANDGSLYSWGSNMFNRLGLNGQPKKEKGEKLQSQGLKAQNPSSTTYSPNTSRQGINLSNGSIYQEEPSFTDRRPPTSSPSSLSNIQKVKIPRQILTFTSKKIHQLSLGTYHVIALTSEGECFSWGNGIYGQLGNNKFGQCSPQLITTKHLTPGIVFVACSAGEQHSCLLDKDGMVYTCGSNSYGVLGHLKHENQTRKKRCKIFEKVEFFEENNVRIREITSGDRHILAMTETSEIYGWGSNKHCQVTSTVDSRLVIDNQKSVEVQPLKDSYSYSKHHNKVEIKHVIDSPEICHKTQQNNVKLTQKQEEKKQQNQIQQNSNKVEDHLNDLPEELICQKTKLKLKNWREKFNVFLIQKRKEQDELMKELDQIVNNSK